MKLLTLASLALVWSAGTALSTSAQPAYAYQDPYPGPADNPNVQAFQDYQHALSAYDAARDAAFRDDEDFKARSSQYRADERAYRRELRAYEQARADYDAEYGPGAYEAYYAPPAPPPPY